MKTRLLMVPGVIMTLSGAVALAQTALAETAVDCAAIDDAEQRLACFDRIFGRDGAPAEPAPQALPPPAAAEPAEPAPQPPLAAPASPAAPDNPVAPDPAPRKGGGMLGLDEVVDLATTVTAVRYREQQKMVFGLANGQVWMQVTPRYVRIREGDEVTIQNATMGGYLMKSASQVTTRVTRIH